MNGEYGLGFVYLGPTAVPFGGREWAPPVLQVALAAVSAVPCVAALRTPSSPVANAFILVFAPNAMLAVIAALGALLLWRQEGAFPEYWQNP